MTRPDFARLALLEDAPRRCGEPVVTVGVCKQNPEDFIVDEIPAYEPSGDGEHLFLRVEKRDVASEQLRGYIARTLEIPPAEVGIAGNKDRRAVTRQWLSVPIRCSASLERVDSPAIRILESRPHGNKLRTGHLRGNRFDILLRGTSPSVDEVAWSERAAAVSERGFANYFGTQRFGGGETLESGWKLLAGEISRRTMTRTHGRSLLRLALSAVQSAVFNEVLAVRLRTGRADQVLPGDVMMFRDRRTQFVAEDPDVEQSRVDHAETCITGPLVGPKMTAPRGEPATLEQSVLDAFGLPVEAFRRFAKLTAGTRRPLLHWPTDLQVAREEQGVRLRFTLGSGSYATVLMREFVERLDVASGSVSPANGPHRFPQSPGHGTLGGD